MARRIVYVSSEKGRITGGIKVIHQHVRLLNELGFEALVAVATDGPAPALARPAPRFRISAKAPPRRDDLLVLPEDQPWFLERARHYDPPVTVFVQNPFFMAVGLPPTAAGYGDFGVARLMCASRFIDDWCRETMADLPTMVVPCPVDPALFHPRPKRRRILALPGKRPLLARTIRWLFHRRYPDLAGRWEWVEMQGRGEAEVAAAFGTAEVFLSLSLMEGLGLTPLEAMASDCVVAGFTGQGGQEYATPDNGFWSDDESGREVVDALARAVACVEEGGAALAERLAAGRRTVAAFTPAATAEALEACFRPLV